MLLAILTIRKEWLGFLFLCIRVVPFSIIMGLHLAVLRAARAPLKAKEVKKRNECFRPGSNRRPSACEADVITTTLRKHTLYSGWCNVFLPRVAFSMTPRVIHSFKNIKTMGRLVFHLLREREREKKTFLDNKCLTYGHKMFPAGLEPATFRVWGGRDNHYNTETHVSQGMDLMYFYHRRGHHSWIALRNQNNGNKT